jgi:hypothetical protein
MLSNSVFILLSIKLINKWLANILLFIFLDEKNGIKEYNGGDVLLNFPERLLMKYWLLFPP